jgi:hypothetical protein
MRRTDRAGWIANLYLLAADSYLNTPVPIGCRLRIVIFTGCSVSVPEHMAVFDVFSTLTSAPFPPACIVVEAHRNWFL